MREINIPAQQVFEEIKSIEEIPPHSVMVMVGKTNENGKFIVPQSFSIYMIDGENYIELNGPSTSWAPDKPNGTYRNEDLWHYIDLQRNANA